MEDIDRLTIALYFFLGSRSAWGFKRAETFQYDEIFNLGHYRSRQDTSFIGQVRLQYWWELLKHFTCSLCSLISVPALCCVTLFSTALYGFCIKNILEFSLIVNGHRSINTVSMGALSERNKFVICSIIIRQFMEILSFLMLI